MNSATTKETVCPGCGLVMPRTSRPTTHAYYNSTPECWSLYTEVLEAEYSNPMLFGQVHQLTVDTYAVQHAGGHHPDKSVGIHLCGLHLMLNRGVQPTAIPAIHQLLASMVKAWPHFTPPEPVTSFTVFDVVFADTSEEHVNAVKEWSRIVWRAWSPYHAAIAQFVATSLPDLALR